eukprot:NODE_1785_length_492_cov_9.316027_g1707_i0.p3 GENE.NODE_1785_length_492_cov_9.316027_g1707_i0~~NODE_1785_length_492_cov_9.316027_g1707_i0.p3  ORF type:complete len:57 (+),score=11.19 NODE_1785_length_492_cov_9.316027_g1707_i0:301-471(+)
MRGSPFIFFRIVSIEDGPLADHPCGPPMQRLKMPVFSKRFAHARMGGGFVISVLLG